MSNYEEVKRKMNGKAQSYGWVPNPDQMALNHVASEMRKTAMKFVNDRDSARLMRAGELLAQAIEKDASRIGASGLMEPNVEAHASTERRQDASDN